MRPDYPDLFISPTPQIESPLHWDTNPVKLKELLTALDVDKAISTLSGIESDISAWSYVPKNNDETGGQIDLVIQRADRVINLCEMKYSSAPFVIKNSYIAILDCGQSLWRTRKQIRRRPWSGRHDGRFVCLRIIGDTIAKSIHLSKISL